MHLTGYHATGYHATPYYRPEVQVIIPPVGGGGSGGGPSVGLPGESYFNQAPPRQRDNDLFLQQAIQEDEEMLLMIKAFVETIQ